MNATNFKTALYKALPAHYGPLDSGDVQPLSKAFFLLAAQTLPKPATFQEKFDYALSRLTFYIAQKDRYSQTDLSNLSTLLSEVLGPNVNSLSHTPWEHLLKDIEGYKTKTEITATRVHEESKVEGFREKIVSTYKNPKDLLKLCFNQNQTDPFKKKVYKRLSDYAIKNVNETIELLYYTKIPALFPPTIIDYFTSFFREQFLLEDFHQNDDNFERILSLDERLEASFPYTMRKLIKSQTLKQRKVQAVIFCKLEGDESLYVSNTNGFPLLTKVVATKEALSEEMLMKLTSLNYKEIALSFKKQQTSETLVDFLRKLLQSGEKKENRVKRGDILGLQLCELLFYIEVPRWPGALIHNVMYLDLLKKNVNLQLTELPMSMREVMGKVVQSLRSAVGEFHSWNYDYRHGDKFSPIKNVFSRTGTFDNLYHRVYFQGAELRLFLIWKIHNGFLNKDHIGLEGHYLIEIWPALFGLFKTEDQAEEKKERHLEETLRKLHGSLLSENEEIPEPTEMNIEGENHFVIYTIKQIMTTKVFLQEPFKNNQTLNQIGKILADIQEDFSKANKNVKKAMLKVLREVLILIAIPFLVELGKKHNKIKPEIEQTILDQLKTFQGLP